jgi:aminoglycoside phosphotransferase
MSLTEPKSNRGDLPEGLTETLEAQTGEKILAVRRRAGGGASRNGAEVDLAGPDGTIRRAYLSFDTRGVADRQRTFNFRREASVLRALSGHLAGAGIKAPRVLGADEAYLALLSELVEGEASFTRLKNQDERRSVGLDFMRQLAALHALDAEELDLDGYDPPERAWRDALNRIAERRAAAVETGADPQIVFALHWLERHAPPPPARIVLLHGDCGPGNFIYKDGQVAANLDWELTRYGDPMEDLAMLCIRDLIQNFIPLPEAFAAYEAAGGPKIDLDRVRYHRLSNQLGFMTSGLTRREGPAPEPPVLGMSLVFEAMHMRVMAEQLAELSGVHLPPVALPDVPPSPHAGAFEIALKDLRDVIVPRSADQLAAEKSKGLARLVKFWRDRERFGAAYDAAEIEDITSILGGRFGDLVEARAALRTAIVFGTVDEAACIRLFHARAMRETAIMADAMGGLSRSHFSPLET